MHARYSLPLVYFLSAASLVCTAVAHPLKPRDDKRASMQMTKRYNMTGGSARILHRDQARAGALKAAVRPGSNGFGAFDEVDSFGEFGESDEPGQQQKAEDVISNALVSYIAQVFIGNPPTEYELIVDSGSSNTWVGAGQPFTQSATTKTTGRQMSVTYGTGFFYGDMVQDQILVGNLNITDQAIGAATKFRGFDAVDGILGIGPCDLTIGTVRPAQPSEQTNTIVDSAALESRIGSTTVGVYFQPPNSDNEANGEITFGYIDESKLTGPLNLLDFTTVSPANKYVGIDQSITYGLENTPIVPLTSGIVDTGTSLILFTSDAYGRYVNATGATLDEDVGLLSLPVDQFWNLQSMFFNINGLQYEFTNDAQIWPRSLNDLLGGSSDKVYLIIGDGGDNVGDGIDFINGQAFLERYYTAYDSVNQVFGIATTAYTNALTNWS